MVSLFVSNSTQYFDFDQPQSRARTQLKMQSAVPFPELIKATRKRGTS